MRVWFTQRSLIIFLLFSITGYTCYCQQSGIIYTQRTSPVGIVNYAAPVSAIGLGTGKFIDGYVRKYGSTTFIFPVGDNGSRRPFAAAADGTIGAYFGVDPSVAITSNPEGGDYAPLPTGAPFSKDSKDGDIRAISSSEYWDINGTNPTKITLTWTASSNITALLNGSNLSKLFIVGWNGTRWVKITSIIDPTSVLGGASTAAAGSISTEAAIVPNTYNVYSFGVPVDGPLPVNLVSFKGIAEGKTARLEWTTTSEVNSERFDIERSDNGKNWEYLGSVKTQGEFDTTSKSDFHYNYVDSKPLGGENFYRLKMIDKDGTFAFSRLISLLFDENAEVSFFPNPVSDILFIKGLDLSSVKEVTLYDLSGRSAYAVTTNLSSGIDVKKLPVGIYTLRVLHKNGSLTTHKILVRK